MEPQVVEEQSLAVEFGEQIARARQGSGLSEQAFAHFVGEPDAAHEEIAGLRRAIIAADDAANQARRRALAALERADAELEALAEREKTLVAREQAFAALEEAIATRAGELDRREEELGRREEAAGRWLTELSAAYRLVKAAE
jgi:hypothetical protein